MQGAKMSIKQKTFMKQFMSEFMKLQEDFYNPQENPNYWDELVSRSMDLINRNKTTDERQNMFCENMVLAFLNTRQ